MKLTAGKLIARVFATSLALSCAIAPLAVAHTLAQDDIAEARTVMDLAYHDGADFDDRRHRLNLVLPARGTPRATVLWIHGGAWAAGDRSREMTLAQGLADQGIAVAVMSYRLSPGRWMSERLPDEGIQHPEHIRDVARAFAWLWNNASEYGLDQNALFVSGYSAGGHLSALLAMDERYLGEQGLEGDTVRGAIPVAGTYDIENYYELILDGLGEDVAVGHVLGVFGSREGHAAASPASYLDGYDTPTLIISKGESAIYTQHFEAIVEGHPTNQVIDFVYFSEETHNSLFFQLADAEAPSAARDAMISFIDQTLRD